MTVSTLAFVFPGQGSQSVGMLAELAEQKMARIAQAMGLADDSQIEDAIRHMTRTLGLPTGLGELDVNPDLFPRIVQGALADHSHRTNPREASAEDYQWLLEASM